MKLIKLTSLTGLMIISVPVLSGVIDNSQIMPPPGPYQSIMNNTPPAFVPYGSKQAQANPHNQNVVPQAFNHFPADTRSMVRPSIQPPEWVLNQQKAVKESIENMLKENTERYKQNQMQYDEYIKKSEASAEQREKDNRKWIEENNKQMKQTWKNMLDQYAKNQKQQILDAKNLPEWMKDRMLKQHEQQVAMMNSNPPMAMHNNQRQMATPPQMQRNFNQPAPAANQNYMRPQMRPDMQPNMQPNMNQAQMFRPQQVPMPANRMQPPMQPPARSFMQPSVQQGQPFMRQPYPVAPYNNYRR